MCGVDACFPIDFGTLYVLVNALLLIFSLIFDRHYIGIATFINLFFLGYVVSFSQDMLEMLLPSASIAGRTVSFLLGFLLLSFSKLVFLHHMQMPYCVSGFRDSHFYIAQNRNYTENKKKSNNSMISLNEFGHRTTKQKKFSMISWGNAFPKKLCLIRTH